MADFRHLTKLLPYIDEAFQAFYDDMLNDARLSVFFSSPQQIQQLVATQKAHLKESIHKSKEELKTTYIWLGEFHYDLRIPYIDFVKGTEILEEQFLLKTQSAEPSRDSMDEIFTYFKLMKAYTAKGYLNRMISEDKRDIDAFFEQSDEEKDTYLPKSIVLEKITWLRELLDAIENQQDVVFDETLSVFSQWVDELDFLTLEKRTFFENLEQRIQMNTHNLFYFLKREEYLEILPLYTSLLSIYKLTLMMNNALTLEYAGKIIEDMKQDSLSKLFRKDLFEELLKVEMDYVKRHDDYGICVAYIDIDNFKGINDNFGHYSGDKAIEKIGEVIRQNIRSSDLGFRIGGDEFAIIFKNATKQQARNVCQKIKIDLTAFEFIFTEEVTFNVSISVGISQFPHQSKKNMQDLIKSVDRKLYEAKAKGKNQICI